MNRTNIFALIIILLILIGAGAATFVFLKIPRDASNSEAKKVLASSETQVFTDLSGKSIDLSAYKGKVRIVNSWASWSPFSVQELKDLNEIASEYRSQNVVVIAINRKETKEEAQRFLNYVGALDNLVFAIDVNDTYYSSVGGYAMPETIFYDTKGNIVEHARGPLSKDQMKTDLDKALAEKN